MLNNDSHLDVHHTITGLSTLRGGSAVSVANLCKNMAAQGIRTSIHTLDLGPAFGERLIRDQENLRIYYSRCWTYGRFKLIVPLGFNANLLRNATTAMTIHSNGIWLPINHSSARFAKKRGIPHIISPRGMLEPWALQHKSFKKKIAWLLYQGQDLTNASAFCAASMKEAESIRNLGLHQPIAVIPNGVDIFALNPLHERPRSTFRALYLSRLHPVKGILDLIEAWRRIKVNNPGIMDQWRLQIAGFSEEGYESKIKDALRVYGLEKQVDLLGPVYGREKQILLNKADLFVFPTHSENFGNVVVEALAAGVPVITTKGAPWEDLVSHRCGWWTEVGADGCYDALMKAFRLSEQERREMGIRGRLLVEANYTWESVSRRMADFYRWVLLKGSRPQSVLLDF